jgi:hypothetical protein
METIIITTKLIVRWRFKNHNHIKVSICKKIVNCKTGNVIKKTLSGRSVGYNIEGKFYKLSNINEFIELIPKKICPF